MTEQEKRLIAISKYFKIFMTEVMGFTNADFQDELDDVITNPDYKKIVAAFPRDHGKSTHLSVAYPLWEMALDHNLRFLLISGTASISAGFVNEMINHIEGNEKYRYWSKWVDPAHKGVVPKLRKHHKKEEKWSSTAITIERDALSMKDPTINALGLFGSIISKRCDRLIGDDIVNQQNSETPEQRQKIKDWFYTTALPVLVPGGRCVYLGNTWNADDLVANLLKDPQFDYMGRKSAIITESTHQELWQQYASMILDMAKDPLERKKMAQLFYEQNQALMDDGVKVLWPDRYPYKDLYLKRLSNSYAFSRMYQCDPTTNPNQKVKEEWLNRAKEKGKHLKLQEYAREGVTVQVCASGLDLAISEKETADDVVLLTLDFIRIGDGIIQAGDYVIRDIWRGKFSPNQVKDKITEHYYKIQPAGIRVETVAYQDSIRRDLGDRGVPVRGYHTGGEKNDSEMGVNSLAILLELGKLVIPFDMMDARTVELSSKLVDELRSWPSGHTGDSLMALWFAFSEIRDLTANQYTIPSLIGQQPAIPGLPEELKNPEKLKEAEKIVDQAMVLESEYERSQFNNLFRRR